MRPITPEIKLILDPMIKYGLAKETTASLEDRENWKSVNKTAQKLIRYDVVDKS